MDVIALAQHGIPYAVATLGTSTSETHLERLFRLVPEVVFCFDGDDAGRKAAFRGLEATLPAMQDGRQSKFLFLPEGEDPDTKLTLTRKARSTTHIQIRAHHTPCGDAAHTHFSTQQSNKMY
jgi:DNA primase